MDKKLDKVLEGFNELKLQSNKDDNQLELRLKAIETELTLQKETAKNNQYGDAEKAWPKFIDKLESLDIAVYGITDYFSIRNYLKVKEYQDTGRLKGKTILPNVELRIEPVTGKGTPINIHVIFDPTLTKNEIDREFFRELKFRYNDAVYFYYILKYEKTQDTFHKLSKGNITWREIDLLQNKSCG